MNPPRQEHAYPPRALEAASVDDAAVVQRMAGGDEGALAAFYDHWVPQVYSLVAQLLRDADEAEDVVEETFWQVWQRAASYDPARGTVRTWVLTIARTRALDHLRARQRRPEPVVLEELVPAGDDADPSLDAESRERRQLVMDALAALPAEQRRALELAYFGGFTQTEIAERLAEPLGTVKTRMRLGMRKLRDTLLGLREEK
jgi:RNA polymerase sigma-70 factor (ECF subfamily)